MLARIATLSSMVLLAACSQTAGGASPGPADAVWPQGNFELEADIAYRSEGPIGTSTRRVKHRARLRVTPDGDMQMTSTTGLCQPDPRDKRVRNRRFLCGEATYEIEPSGDMVSGRVSVRAEVMVPGLRRCSGYSTDANGNRTCVRWDTPLETQWKDLTERLRVRRIEGASL